MGDKQFFIPYESNKTIKWSKGIPSDIEKKIKETIIQTYRPKETDINLTLEYAKTDQNFKDRLFEFEADDPLVRII